MKARSLGFEPYSDDDDKFLRENHHDMAVEEMAAHLGRSVPSVRQRLKMLMLSRKRSIDYYGQDIKEMSERGMSNEEIAKELGVSIASVRIYKYHKKIYQNRIKNV